MPRANAQCSMLRSEAWLDRRMPHLDAPAPAPQSCAKAERAKPNTKISCKQAAPPKGDRATSARIHSHHAQWRLTARRVRSSSLPALVRPP
eukprot:2710106-Alexandrium_andersonii.AAC.1